MIVAPYYAGWSQSTLPPSVLPWDTFTHIIHFSVLPTQNGGLDTARNWITTENSRVLIEEAHKRGKKVLLAVGGTPGSENFPSACNLVNRATFVRNLVEMVTSRGYDGLDLDWETAVNNTDYISLIRALRIALPTSKILSAVYFGSWASLASKTHESLDWVAMMTYLPYGQPADSHNSPIYGSQYARIDNLVREWVAAGTQKDKIVFGAAAYASVWDGGHLVAPETAFIAAQASGYYSGLQWDSTARAAYFRSGSKFVSMENERAIIEKAAYAKAQGLGGFIVWELGVGRLGNTVPLMGWVGKAFLGATVPTPPPIPPPTPTPTVIRRGSRVRVTGGRKYLGQLGTVSNTWTTSGVPWAGVRMDNGSWLNTAQRNLTLA